MKSLPSRVSAYKRTPDFTADTVPGGLLNQHHTKAGVWGLLHVERGSVEYVIGGSERHRLTPELPGVIEPEVRHHIRPAPDAVFYIEFYRQPETSS